MRRVTESRAVADRVEAAQGRVVDQEVHLKVQEKEGRIIEITTETIEAGTRGHTKGTHRLSIHRIRVTIKMKEKEGEIIQGQGMIVGEEETTKGKNTRTINTNKTVSTRFTQPLHTTEHTVQTTTRIEFAKEFLS